MDNATCHNDRKISLEHNKIDRALAQLILPISARVAVGYLVFSKKTYGQELPTSDEIIEAIMTT
jgi:hypothetical protein